MNTPGAAKTNLPRIALEAHGRSAAAIPFRMLRIVERGIQILVGELVGCFVEDHLEGDATWVAQSVIIVILLVPLDDELAIGLRANDTVIDISSREQVVPNGEI